ncbi:MAG: hypothetical protein ACJAT4_002545 [Granulosicoccus sp.]|jgi:hypothetical protein
MRLLLLLMSSIAVGLFAGMGLEKIIKNVIPR